MSSFHTLNVGAPNRSDEEGWAPQSSSSSSLSSPGLRRALLVALLGSLVFAAVFASGLAVLRSSERGGAIERNGGDGVPFPARPLSEASPLPPQKTRGAAAAAAAGGNNSTSLSSSPPPSSPPLRFLVIGDWGRHGNRAQREVAAAMTRRVREVREAAAAAAAAAKGGGSRPPPSSSSAGFHPSFIAAGPAGPEFVLTVGDNFYQEGLLSPEDPAFEESFVEVYSSRELVRERESF